MSAPVVGVAVLAAGRSARMGAGQSKQMLPYPPPHGTGTLVRHAAGVARDSAIGPVIVVLGHEADRVRDALAGLDVATAVNAAWQGGMSTSIGVATRWARDVGAAALLLTAVDQPDVTAATLRRLRDRFVAGGCGIVACGYGEAPGIPVLFAARYFDALLTLTGDRGARPIVEQHQGDTALLDCPEAAFDVDDPDDLRRLADPHR